MIVSLYGLPHFGEDLERSVKVNEKTADAVFREKIYNVSAGRHWDGQKRKKHKRSGSRSQSRP